MSDLGGFDSGAFAKRIAIRPQSVKGTFRTFKTSVLVLAYSIYFILPWLKWDRGEGLTDQAMRFDIVGRKFYTFDLVVYAQDIFWLAALLIIGAMLLFFVTGVAGRAFCGYFCFQTLWTDAFMFIERFVQGERNKQLRLEKMPWNLEKIFKLGLTHLLIIFLAFWTGFTFVTYWTEAYDLIPGFFLGEAPLPAYVTTFILTVSTYIMGQFAREQVCNYMCPYARFQSVMFDMDTYIPAYDLLRGEAENGRRKASKGFKTIEERQQKGHGDCIDCGVCVDVCPTGVDIRKGNQLQCIQCGLCIDACNNIMDKVNFPRGLIGYYSENQLERKPGSSPFLKWKSIAYASVIFIALGILVKDVLSREAFEATLNQIRQPLTTVLSTGEIQNRYNIKLANKSKLAADYTLRLQNLNAGVLDMGRFDKLTLNPENNVTFIVSVKVPGKELKKENTEFKIVAVNLKNEQEQVIMDADFIAPRGYIH